MRSFVIAIIALCLSPALVQASAKDLTWSDLVDPTVQDFEDPYRDLTVEQLYDLGTVVRLRARLDDTNVSAEARPQIEERLADTEDALTKAGIEIDWLLSQRWIVAERRQKAMTAANLALDGSEVVISGYAIPAPSLEDGTRVAYLVPERGMCSHTPAPPPNQMVRLLLSEDWSPSMMHEPVVVSGRLSIDPTSHQMLVVDGFMTLDAAFSMDVSSAKTFRNTQTTPVVNEWAAGIADRFRRTEKPETGND